MDLSMNNINNITLSYFTNKAQYEHIKRNLNKKTNDDDLGYIKDKKFYKKRILDLNKKLFRNEIQDKELIKHFDIYVNTCIKYLKVLDTTDLLQKQYKNMDLLESDSSNNDINNDAINYENCDHLITNQGDVKKVNLNTYVIKTSSAKKKPIILPEKQKININTKEYKTKGIKKKKNITNNYDEDSKE